MKKLAKEDLQGIETYFNSLKNDGISSTNSEDIEKILNRIYNKKFKVNIISSKERKYSFVMAVIPEKSVVEKITKSVANNDTKTETIVSLWKKCNSWIIEIDDRIIDSTFNEKELTALLLHEIGHVVDSDSVPKRIVDVVQYTFISSNFETKSLLKKKVFNSLLSIPIVNACVYGNTKNDLKKELKADQYAVKNGYLDPLLSAMNKIEIRSIGSNNMEKSMDFSMKTLEALKTRKGALMKEKKRLNGVDRNGRNGLAV